MTTLAIDTATAATAVALCRTGSEPIEARDDPPAGSRPRHATRLLPLAAAALEAGGVGWPGLERIVVGTGPGTFTGLRIGLATARALAQARVIPVLGVSTLASLALGAQTRALAAGSPAVLAVIDARRGELFAAAWRADAGTATLARPGGGLLAAQALTPDRLAAWAAASAPGALAAGDGALLARAPLEAAGVYVPEGTSEVHRVSARWHCALAEHLEGAAAEPLPEYIREPDATPRSPAAP